MGVPPVDRHTAWRDGWHAHKNNVEQDANPYDEKAQQRSNWLWLSGWCARFQALKRGYDRSEDDRVLDE